MLGCPKGLLLAMLCWRSVGAIEEASIQAVAYVNATGGALAVMTLRLDGSIFATFARGGKARVHRDAGRIMNDSSIESMNSTANAFLDNMIDIRRQIHNGSGEYAPRSLNIGR